MGEIYDWLRHLGKRHSSTSEEGKPLGRNAAAPALQQADRKSESPVEKKHRVRFFFRMSGVVFLMAVGGAVAGLFFMRAIERSRTASRVSEQIEVLLEMQGEDLGALREHLQAVEAEFRRAFKKDRGRMDEMQAQISAIDGKAAERASGTEDIELINGLMRVQDDVAQLKKIIAGMTVPGTE